ncbi:MAG: twin-arginine translocation signal domain-containing protein, partial [Verrucomicrobia bacterium]|nr:twin-arginine translocation signal domain-containing protein [Verrucomicrobiota bacterium]
MPSAPLSRRHFLQRAALASAPLLLPARVWAQATAPRRRYTVGC